MRGPADPAREREPRRARAAVSAAFAAQGLGFAVLVTHLPDFTDRFRLSDAAVTLLLFMVTVLAGVGSVASEALAARTSSRTALRVGLAGVAVSLSIAALAGGLPVAAVGFAAYGLSVGAVDATSNMQGVAVQHRYGRSVIASFHACWSAAAIAGALYVAAGGSRGLGLGGSIVPVAVVVLLVAALIGRGLIGAAPTQPAPTQPDNAPPAPAGPAPWRPILLLGLALTCFWAVDAGISNWSALFLDGALHAGSGAALGYAGYQVTALLSRLVGDHAARRFGPAATVRVAGLLGCAGTLLVIAARDPAWAVAGFAITGVGLPVVAPLCFSSAAAATRTGGAAAVDHAIARLNIFNYAGSLIGAAAVGAVGSLSGLRWGFAVSLLLAVAVVGLAPSFRSERDAPIRSA